MPSKKIKIILDTNVLYAGLYSSIGASFKVLQAINNGKVRLVISVPLLFEYEDILRRNMEVLDLSEIEVESILDYLCLISEHQKIYFLWRPKLPDPKDDHLLELAIASGTKYIVNNNKKDFKGIDDFGIRPINPKELLGVIS